MIVASLTLRPKAGEKAGNRIRLTVHCGGTFIFRGNIGAKGVASPGPPWLAALASFGGAQGAPSPRDVPLALLKETVRSRYC